MYLVISFQITVTWSADKTNYKQLQSCLAFKQLIEKFCEWVHIAKRNYFMVEKLWKNYCDGSQKYIYNCIYFWTLSTQVIIQ